MNARVRALTVLIAVFLLGCSAGFISYHMMRSKVLPNSSIFGNRTPGRDRSGPMLQQLLELSPDQQTQFGNIVKEFRPQFEAVRADEEKKLEPIRAEMDPKFEAVQAEMAPKFDAIRAEMNRRISSILNDDQRKKFEAIQKEREGRGERGGVRHRLDHPGPPPEGRK